MGVFTEMRVLKGICIIAALFTIWGTFEPWLVFSGEIEHILIGTYEVSGYIFGFGIGLLSSSSASVTVWSNEQYFSSASSDFWFGLLPLIGGVLNLILAWRLEKMKDYRVNGMIVIVGCIVSILGCFLVISYYSPYVFVIHGQIDSLIINGAFLFAENATVSIGIGLYVSLVASIISSSTYLILQWKMKREQ